MKMFELPQLHLFTPERKKRGGTHWRFIANCWQGLGLGGMEYGARTWTWTPNWLALMDMGGFEPEAANQGGGYAGMVHGITCRPNSKPKPAATPAIGGPPATAPPQALGVLRQGPGGNLPRLGAARHGMFTAFER